MSRRRHKVTIYNAYDLLTRPDDYTRIQIMIDGGCPAGMESVRAAPDGSWWVPARSFGPTWGRWKALWLVWTGRADVLHWPGQER